MKYVKRRPYPETDSEERRRPGGRILMDSIQEV